MKNGDSVEISYNKGKFLFKSLNKNSNDANYNIFKSYFEFKDSNNQLSTISAKKSKTKSLNDLFKINEELYQYRVNFLQNYSSKNEIGDEYKTMFLDGYKFAQLRSDYWDSVSYKNKEIITQKYNELKNFVTVNGFSVGSFSDFFEIFLDFNRLNAKELIEDRKKFAQHLFQEMKNNFKGFNRDMLVLTLIQRGNNTTLKKQFLDDFGAFVSDKDFLLKAEMAVKNNIEEDVANTKTETLLKTSNGETITLENLISKYNGKVVYVDFWASWCGPCLQKIPASLRLANILEQVKFVYISIDSNEEQWNKSNAKNLKNYHDSYFLLNQKSASLINDIKLSSIPRHIIFGKQGKLVNDDAPGALWEKLDEFLSRYYE